VSPKKPPPRKGSGGKQPPRSFPVMWIVIGVIVVLGVVAIAVAASSGNDSATSAKGVKQFGTPTITGKALPQFDQTVDDPAVGLQAPVVHGQNFRGQPQSIEPNGKARFIIFLAHWCPHCNREAPKLADDIRTRGVPDNVDLTIVPTGSNSTAPNWPPSQWVKDIGLGTVQTVVDDQQQRIAAAYGLTSYPFMVMLDAQGKVVARRAGEQEDGFFAQAFSQLAAGQTITAGAS
jgi:cytochrome c biogenesis protein CcmG, thiol:disulfide interchange protein DsbE